jgi:hypothetical protein
MLNPHGKTPSPDWAAPYIATWQDDQWIVVFPTEGDARRGLLVMQADPHAPRLAAAPYPDNSNLWYVGVA